MNPEPPDDGGRLLMQRPRDGGKSPYQFSPEEMRVMRDCNKESFFQRCIPLGTAMGLAAYFGVNAGYLSKSPRFGAAPKVTVAVIIGYFVGKFSYQAKCAEKLMQLPNSEIGEMLRQRRRGNIKETLEPGLGPGLALAPFSGFGNAEQYSDIDQRNNNDIDTTRPQNDGLDDSHRPSVDNPTIYEEEMPPQQKHTTSYDELRKRNREDFASKRTASYRDTPTSASAKSDPSSFLDASSSASGRDSSGRSITNKYGDTME